MTVQTIRFEIARLLADANTHLHEVEEALAHGEGRDRIKAAGELVSLRRRKEALEARLEDVDHCPPGAAAGLLQRLREEGMRLRQTIEDLVAH
jgi:hypothetical protein